MELQLSSRVAARLIVALAKPKLSPVAQAAAKHEPRLLSLIVKSAKKTRDAVPMRELESVLIFGGSGAPLYVLEDVLKAWERELLGNGVEAAPTDWIRMRAAGRKKDWQKNPIFERRQKELANKKDLPSVLQAAIGAGANAAEVCVRPLFGQGDFEARYPPAATDIAPGGDYLYHGTSVKNLPSIRAEGLKPMFTNPLSVAPHLDSARYWGAEAGGSDAVLLRTPRKGVKLLRHDIEDDYSPLHNTAEDATMQTIGADRLEVYHDGVWYLLKSMGLK